MLPVGPWFVLSAAAIAAAMSAAAVAAKISDVAVAAAMQAPPPATPPPAPPSPSAANPPPAPAALAPADSLPPLGAPAVPDTIPRRFNLKAGSARSFIENGERVTILEGNVRLESEGTTIDSRRARAFRERELAYFYEDVVVHDRDLVMNGDEGEFSRPTDTAILRGRVRIQDPRGDIRSERARYWRDRRIIWLWGDVDFKDEKTRVQADSVLYREAEGLGEAFGHVVITDLETGSEARGPHAIYDRNTGMARLDPQPEMVLRQSGQQDTEVAADKIEVDRDKSVVRARGNVRIRRGDTIATADSAFLYKARDRVELRGHPELRQRDTRMVGREIDVHYHGDAVDRVEVRRDAQIVQSRADTLLVPGPNTVAGDSADIYFDAGELQRAIVIGKAHSRYVPQESRPDRISVNEAEADSIVMLFREEDVEEVIFTGNARGIYRFFEGDLEALRKPVAARFDSVFGVVRGDTIPFDFQSRAEPVDYSAERIIYVQPQNDLLLQRAAEVTYQGRTLRAGRIRFDADTDLLDASERPVLDDSGDRMYGDEMGYDMASKNAWVEGASTQYDQGFYSGKQLRKSADGVLYVAHGSYTTCDLAHPHYRFECDEMKVLLREKVVGRPVRLYLGNVPVGWLPFLYNSIGVTRHSGFLQPDIEIGIFGQGRFIRGLQYYWAASPYFDLLFGGDYTERNRPNRATVGTVLADTVDSRSVGLRLDARYKVRYNFDGMLSYYTRNDFANNSRFWSLSGWHSQTIGERATLRGNLDYASSNTALRQVFENVDYQRSLQRQLTSTLTFNRPSDLLSVNATVQRKQVLDPEENFQGSLVNSTLPQLSLSFRSIRLAPSPRIGHDEGLQGFLHALELRPQVSFSRTTSEIQEVVGRVHPGEEVPTPHAPGIPDSTDQLVPGSGLRAFDFLTRDTEVIAASTGASLGRQVNGWIFSLNPAVNYSERYVKDSERPDARRHFRTFSTSLGASTTFYGLFRPNRWGLNAVRHRIAPSAGLSYVPEIAGQQARSTVVNLRLSNTIDTKIRGGKGERRIDGVFDWTLGTTYVPTIQGRVGEPDRKFTNIGSTITLNRPGPFALTITQTYDPYRGRILSTQIPFSFRMSGYFGYGDTGMKSEARNRVTEEEGVALGDSAATDTLAARALNRHLPTELEPVGDPSAPEAERPRGDLGWNVDLSYTLVRTLDATNAERVGISMGVRPTRNWTVKWWTGYDAVARQFTSNDLRVIRNLHCWKASFARVRYAGEWRYYFRIYVDRHQDDLFFESGDRALGYSGY